MRLALNSVSLAELLRSGRTGAPASLLAARSDGGESAWVLAVATAKLRRRAVPVRSLRALAKAALTDAALAATGGAGSGERAMAALIAEGRAMAERTVPAAPHEACRADSSRRR